MYLGFSWRFKLAFGGHYLLGITLNYNYIIPWLLVLLNIECETSVSEGAFALGSHMQAFTSLSIYSNFFFRSWKAEQEIPGTPSFWIDHLNIYQKTSWDFSIFEMEKICEFCTTSRPVVYCKSDAAHLCLSCDAKVHSANALSNRHLRTLLCDSCRIRPSYVRCLDHRMFMCHGCDKGVHDISSQHQRRAVSSYLGCPSAKDFAALWGFELNELENVAIQDQSLSSSCVSVNPNAVKPENLRQSGSPIGVSSSKSSVTSLPAAGQNIGSNNQQTKVNWQDLLVLKQIICKPCGYACTIHIFIHNLMSAICSKLTLPTVSCLK